MNYFHSYSSCKHICKRKIRHVNLHWTTYFTNIKGIVQQNMHHYNDVIEWVVHCEKWVGEWAQGSKKESLEYIPCHMDSHFVMWQNIPWWGLKYSTMWTKVQHEDTNCSFKCCIYLFKWCLWFIALMWEGFEE